LLTQCPNCETTFRVTAEILRVADGQVRCGRCHTQFDALERLIEEGEPTAAESGRFLHTPPPASSEPMEVEERDSMEEITLEGKRIEISGTYRVMDDDDSGRSHLEQEVTEEWAEIDENETEAMDASADKLDETKSEIESDRVESKAQQVQVPIRATRAPFGSRLQRDEPVELEPADDLSTFATSRRVPAARVWTILVIPLALLLLAQVVHHYRSELARHPQIGAPLMSIYQALGMQLTPDWNLHAYGVKQWGVVMDPASPGTLIVRASITNGASFAQPYPLLKLVLEDRWGDQVRAREFEPAEYLDAGVASNRLLGPAQQTNATISIVDPGPDAEGFRFDVCLRGKTGPVCAAEVPAAR
jgi:predicted Zn finger-like uncharacterized protein